MPRYDYRCKACDKVFEAVRSFSQATEDATCPECQGTASRILASSYTVFSKSYTGWATRVEGTDFPWRDKTAEAAADETEEDAESGEAESKEEKPSNPPSLSRYATIFDNKVGLATKEEKPSPKDESTPD